MKGNNTRKLFLILLALAMALSLFAGCSKADEPEEQEIPQAPSIDQFLNALPLPDGPAFAELPDMKSLAQDKYEINDDTIGWLRVPNTSIDDVVVFYPNDRNAFYLRRDFDKRDNRYGTYFVDYRTEWGDEYKWESMSTNTTIYGHSMEDNPEGLAFSQIKKYLDEDFARANPHFYFSTLTEDMAFEVVAVYYATVELPYNKAEFDDFEDTLSEIMKRSIYNYDTTITASDKLMTLSTCCYNYVSTYPNDYRFVVMGKLVKPGEEMVTEASFTVNPDPKAP